MTYKKTWPDYDVLQRISIYVSVILLIATDCKSLMDKVNVTLRLESDKIALLDQLAQSDDRDRTYLIKQAIDGYLKMRQWQIDEIKKAVAEADAGDFVPEPEMEALLAKWTR